MLRIWLLEVPSPVLGGSVSAGLAVFDGFLLLFISAGRVGQLSPEYPPALYEYFNQPRPQKKKMGWEEIAETRMNIVVGFCTNCGARMRIVEIIPESFHERIRAPDAC